MAEHQCKNTDLLTDLKKAVFGNSQPGLVQQMAILKTEFKSIKAVQFIIFGQLCGVIAGLVILIIKLKG